jgi:HPt (histidine-containing phosphotransfer) domain-containing protein
VAATCFEHETAILDYEALVDRCLGNIQFAERVLAKFLDRFGEDLKQLEEECRQQNGPEIARLAHRMKGASASVSATELSQLAADLEQLGREAQRAETEPQLDQMKEAWVRFGTVVGRNGVSDAPPG